jgi:cytochrome c peroxidase
MLRKVETVAFSALLLGLVILAYGDETHNRFRIPNFVPNPPENQMTPERIELGKMLFFDPRLSGSGSVSCATCHNPALGWSDGLPTAVGGSKTPLSRHTPTIINSAFNSLQMWDGRFGSLEEQIWGPLLSSGEMNVSKEEVIARLQSISGYREAFAKAYPREGITPFTFGSAIASFERSLISRDSAFDKWQAGDGAAVSEAAKRGFQLFEGKANCAACHQGPNFSDQGFHNIGIANNRDEGRFAIVPIKILHGAFKTPSLRDVALRAPYMHNGSYRTLEEVVDHYDRGGDDRSNLDPNMKPLNLWPQEKHDLVEFMKCLTGKQEPVTVPELPR